jgi:Kef-type K+ transport system membrane component KefB/predicted amino acid-binding ACT domain protein
VSVTDVLVDILVVLLAAKLAAELAERARLPAVVGEILAGIVIGPSVLSLVGHDITLEVLAELGVILLLLEVGLELSLGDLRSVGKSSMVVAIIGVVVPVALGLGVALGFGESSDTALFIGTALAATSVGITARVFSDLGALTRIESRTVLGAAVADDVMGLILLTIVVRVTTAGTVSILDIVEIIAIALGFLVLAIAIGTRFGPKFFGFIDRYSRSAGTFVAIALAFTLAFSLLADVAQLAPIVGAFAAGVALSGTAPAERMRRDLAPVGHLFIPVFFLQIGVNADLSAFGDPSLLLLMAALIVVAAIGKIAAGLGLLGGAGDRLLVGLGMLPRGEVGLIFASIGLAEGVLNEDLYAALVAVVLGTTLVAPSLLRGRITKLNARRPMRPPAPPPPGGWLQVREEVELVDVPPDQDALIVALDAARLVAQAPPAATLLDWLGQVELAEDAWDGRATARLLALLREGGVRSWRFLEASGVLERSLPELADAIKRRRADPFVLDPVHVLRFDLVDALRDVVTDDPRAAAAFERLRHPEQPMLAALVLAAAGDGGEPERLARQLADRLRLGVVAEEELLDLVADRALLRAAATRIEGLDEEPVLQLAGHLATPERTRALYLLSLALGELEPWERDRLDELVSRVLGVLSRPELTGARAGSVVEQRRAEALRLVGDAPGAIERVRRAPRAYLLALTAADIARHAALLDPIPRKGGVRSVAVPLGLEDARVEVASRDRPGLLAAVSGVLAARGLEVIAASAATWSDGAAVESFHIRSTGPAADALAAMADLEEAVADAIKRPPVTDPASDLEIDFDDAGSPWHTICEVRGEDRHGLLHMITVGFAATGVTVHSARVETRGGVAIDRFELTDTEGRKLDAAHQHDARHAIWAGTGPAVSFAARLWRRRAVRPSDGDAAGVP